MKSTRIATLACSLPVALAASTAVSQQPPPPPGSPQTEIRERRVEVRVEDGGAPQVMIDGRPVPQQMVIRRGDGTFEVGGDGGAIIEVIEVPAMAMGDKVAAPQDSRPMIGVVLAPVDSLLARHLRLDPAKVTLVAEVMDGSPAMEAGIEAGDILVEIAGEPATIEHIGEVVAGHGDGGELKVALIHEGKKRAVKLSPRMMPMPRPTPPPPGMPPQGMHRVERHVGPDGQEMVFEIHADDLEGMPPGAMAWVQREGGPDEQQVILQFRGMAPDGEGDWEDLRGALERFGVRLGEGARQQAQSLREQWEGPWGEENIRQPMREFRQHAQEMFENQMRQMERFQQEMRERVEMQLREMQQRFWQEAERRLRQMNESNRGPQADRPRSRDDAPRGDRPRRGGGDGPQRDDGPRRDRQVAPNAPS